VADAEKIARYEAALRQIAGGDVAPDCDLDNFPGCECWQCVAREALAAAQEGASWVRDITPEIDAQQRAEAQEDYGAAAQEGDWT